MESLRDQHPGARVVTVVTAVAAVATVVLGAIGLSQLTGYDDSPLNVAFGILTLFAGGGGYHTSADVPATLQVAQLLGPTTSTATVLLVVSSVARQRLRRRRARRYRTHTVVVGSGSAGFVLLRALRDQDDVIVIDRNPSEAAVAFCDQRGWPLLLADALTEDIATGASIAHARRVFIGTGSDSRDVAIARRLAARAEPVTETVTRIHVRLDSSEVARALIAHDHELRTGDGHVIDYVGRYDFSAMVTQEHLVTRLSSTWETPVDHQFASQAVFVGDATMTRALHELLVRSHAARIHLGLPTFADSILPPALDTPDGLADGSIVFVGFESETDTLHHALAASSRHGVRMVVVLVPGGFEPQLLDVSSRAPAMFIDPEALLDGPEMLDEGQIELMARLVHTDYLAKLIERDQWEASKLAHRPWSELRDEIRERNRRQARRFLARLERTGRRLAPLGDGEPVGASTGAELEREAEIEHELWVCEHRAQGWVYGPTEDRDASPPTHPDLVPFDELSDEVQEYDRDVVRRRPALAALLGLQIVVDRTPKAS
mgnify:CR=1 FL=1